ECRILNVDIGGGTTKLAVVERGRVLSTAAFHVGGRLLATDNNGTITVLEPGGQSLAQQAGFEWKIGDQVALEKIERLADHMARAWVRRYGATQITARSPGRSHLPASVSAPPSRAPLNTPFR